MVIAPGIWPADVGRELRCWKQVWVNLMEREELWAGPHLELLSSGGLEASEFLASATTMKSFQVLREYLMKPRLASSS